MASSLHYKQLTTVYILTPRQLMQYTSTSYTSATNYHTRNMKCQIAVILLLALSAWGAEQKSEGRDKRGALLAYNYAAGYGYPYYSAPYAYSPYYSSPYVASSPYTSAAYVASPYTSAAYVASPYTAAYTYYK